MRKPERTAQAGLRDLRQQFGERMIENISFYFEISLRCHQFFWSEKPDKIFFCGNVGREARFYNNKTRRKKLSDFLRRTTDRAVARKNPRKIPHEKSACFDKFCFRYCEIDIIETNCESFSRLVFEDENLEKNDC
jgi:hypothetical protein